LPPHADAASRYAMLRYASYFAAAAFAFAIFATPLSALPLFWPLLMLIFFAGLLSPLPPDAGFSHYGH